MSTVSDLAKILADLRAYHDSSIGEHAFETKCPGVGNCQVLAIMASLEEVMGSLIAPAAKTDAPADTLPVRSPAEARYGAPYEDDGNCELCNASGPVWLMESEGDNLPFCAECIAKAASFEITPATGKAHA